MDETGGVRVKWSWLSASLQCALTVQEGVPVLRLAGELDYSSVADFEAVVDRTRLRGVDRVVLDLSRLTFCDVPGARALNRAHARLESLGVRLELPDPHSAVRRVLEVTGLACWDFGLAVAADDAAQAHREILSEALSAAMRATGARMGSAQYFHQATGTLRLVAHPGFGHRFASFFETVQGYDTSCGAAAADRRPVFVPDVRTSPIFADSPELDVLLGSGVGSCASIPVISGDGLLGVVSTHQSWTARAGRPLPGLTAPILADSLS